MVTSPPRIRVADMGGEEPEEPLRRLRVGQIQRGPRVAERRERGRRLHNGDGVGRGGGRHAFAFQYV
jgi:hypothetical protein